MDCELLQCQENQYLADTLQNPEFQALLSKIARGFKTKAELARRLKITPSRLTRAINVGDFSFNEENCLRLAIVSGVSPSEILRTADKAEFAELIESLYGDDRTKILSAEERRLLDAWNSCDPDAREQLTQIATTIANVDRDDRAGRIASTLRRSAEPVIVAVESLISETTGDHVGQKTTKRSTQAPMHQMPKQKERAKRAGRRSK